MANLKVMGWQHRSVRLTDEAADAWDRICARHGVTLTALLEAMARLAPGDDWPGSEVVALARAIDRERRSRR